MVKYSVIIPSYNEENTIGTCLDALHRQCVSKDSYEVIVVDDGSTDKTSDIIKEFPVKYLFQENNGPALARNRGAQEAQGEIILFTDSDCVPNSNWIEEMTGPFSDAEVIAVKGAYKTRQKSLTASFAQIEFEERFEMLKQAESIDMVDTYSAGFRKSTFLELGGFDPSFPVPNNEDTDLSYKMSLAGYKMVFNPDAIVYHLKHPDSLSRYVRLKFWRGYWRTVVYKKYPNKAIKDTYTPQTLKLQIALLVLFLLSSLFTLFFLNSNYMLSYSFIIVFFLTTIPFSLFAFSKNKTVAILSPLFLLLRALSIGSGSLWGLFFSKRY